MFKRFAVLLLLPMLAACGFQPLYGQGGSKESSPQLSSVSVEPIPEQVGYELRNDLLDLFDSQNAGGAPRYRLKVTLGEESRGVALTNAATTTRYDYYLNAHYELYAAGATAPLTKGDMRTLTAYNVTTSPYATVAAEKDAKSRAANDMAERIRTELAVYFFNANKQAAKQ